MDYIEIKGYKSIKEAKVELKPINILIGANGSGKSNFISFFEFLNNLYHQKLTEYVKKNGGTDKLLFQGSKITQSINAEVSFDMEQGSYSFTIDRGEDGFVFTREGLYAGLSYWDNSKLYSSESTAKYNNNYNTTQFKKYLSDFKAYHFVDTGRNSPFTQSSNIKNDKYILLEDGRNLAAFLYAIQQEDQRTFSIIIKTIQSIAPYFSDFDFHPEGDFVTLLWQSKYSSTTYGPSDFSDGTIRFVALTALLMQPNLPANIIIDEPELGLHPFAISKLAGMIQSAVAKGTQIIVATQSADLINHFNPDDIITVDQVNGETVFKRLNAEKLAVWLEDYSLGDLWHQNILEGGQP